MSIMSAVDVLGWLRKLRRERDQLTVELAEEGVAPESEVRAAEERIEHHSNHTSPGTGSTRVEGDGP